MLGNKMMEASQEEVVVTPHPLRRAGASDSGHESLSSRESLKSISKSIVQQRAQMFEQGTPDGASDAGSVTGSGSGSENGEVQSPSPSQGGQIKETEVIQPKDKPPWQSPERLSPASPKKVSRQAGEVNLSPKTSPTHGPGRTRRTHSPRRGSPVRSPKANCQPKIILGAAPRPVETPVKPPRSKKPVVKLKSNDTPPASPQSPAPKPRVSRSESMNEREKPTPVRKAPAVPGLRPMSMLPQGVDHHTEEFLSHRMSQSYIGDENLTIEAFRMRPIPPEKPQIDKSADEVPQPKPAKPAVPLKPSDLFKEKPQKAAKPLTGGKPEILSEKPILNKPDILKEKPPKNGETPEWLKRRGELMKTRSTSEPGEEEAVTVQAQENRDDQPSTLPMYAVVDKTRKKKPRPKSGEEPRRHESAHYYDSVVLLESAGDIAVDKPGAPPKPPRTFAHDVYMKKKADKRDKRRTHSAGQVQCSQIIANGNREVKTEAKEDPASNGTVAFNADRVEPYAMSTGGQADTSNNSEPVSLYEEIGENKPQKPARPPRPRAPQRPPAPGVLRVRQDQTSVVNVVKHNAQIPEEGFIKSGQRKISNPNYDRHHDIIPIKTYRDQTMGALKRHKSDEYLYADPQAVLSANPPGGASSVEEDPVYQDPVDLAQPRARSCITSHGVSLDEEGYAIPDTQRHTMGRRQVELCNIKPSRQTVVFYRSHLQTDNVNLGIQEKFRSPSFNNTKGAPKWGTLDRTRLAKFTNHDFRASMARKKLPSVREKVSRAYSILRRRPPLTPEGQPIAELSPEEDEDSQVDIEEHQKRLAHVSSIKEKQYATLEYTREQTAGSQPHLFDYAMVVGLEKDSETTKYKPNIMYKYPDQLPSGIDTIAQFCFPDAEQWRPVTQAQTEDFFFVLTSADGARQYGYCRRLLPPGSQNRLPEVYCCVSALGASGFYQQLLVELDKLRQLSPDLPFHLIKAAYAHPVPSPGRETWISCPVNDGKKETVTLKRSLDSRLEKVSFEALFKHLNVDTILKIFGAVLLERRILFTAQHLSTLSSCISALTVILYPFRWQHTFVPVLPVLMIDVCCAPTPYILGILSTALPKLKQLELEEVLIIDLDTNSLIESMGDEQAILPRKLQKCLRSALQEDSDTSGVARDTVIFEAFLRMFVETTGHYTEFMNTQQDGELVFQKEQFTKAVSSKSIRLFLEWFVETQMFEVFITEHLQEGGPTAGLFETRIEEYREEMEQMSLSLKDNVKQIGRKMINLFNEAGGKLKKAFGGERNVYV